MDDLFSDLRDEEEAESPVLEPTESASVAYDDEFDQLRRKSARTGATFDDMDMSIDDEFLDDGDGFSLSNLKTSQKLILLALLMLDLVAIGFGILILIGRI